MYYVIDLAAEGTKLDGEAALGGRPQTDYTGLSHRSILPNPQ